MRTRRWRAWMQVWTWKSASAFLHGRALVNPEIESVRARARVCVSVCVYFFILDLSLRTRSPPLQSAERDGDALFPPPSRSFHLFRSRHCMPRGDELSLSTFSIYLPPTASLFLSPSLSPLLFMADPSGGRIDSTLSRHIREYTFNARRRRIYSPAYFPHFDEWRATSHATSLNAMLFAWFFASNTKRGEFRFLEEKIQRK